MRKINIIHLTDIHGAAYIVNSISNDLQKADLIIISGDITHFGRKKDAERIIDAISAYNSSILAVSGNCDFPETEEYLLNKKMNLHLAVKEIAGYSIAGIGGSLPCPGTTPFEYTDDQAETWLKKIKQRINSEKLLLFVSHQPPFRTINDTLPNKTHVGSKSILNFIKDTQPLVCFTGHIHEGIGIDTIGATKIVNPGPFREGKYARIQITNISVNITLQQITVSDN